jgi:hypothetical protein
MLRLGLTDAIVRSGKSIQLRMTEDPSHIFFAHKEYKIANMLRGRGVKLLYSNVLNNVVRFLECWI